MGRDSFPIVAGKYVPFGVPEGPTMFCRPGRLIFLVCLALLGEHAAAREHANGESTKSPRTAKTIRTDRYGDLLPDGAIARLGSLRFRHEGSVYSLAFSPDDKILAGAQMMSGRIVLWDSRTGKKRREVRTEHQISSLAFSPDGKELAARSIHAEVGFWDTASGDLLREFSLCERPMPPRLRLPYVPRLRAGREDLVRAEARQVRGEFGCT